MIKKILSEEIFRGSFILFLMINIFNFLNYLFHFLTARMLPPAQYGILATLMAIVYIMTIPSESIQTIIAKYSSNLSKNKDYGKLRTLVRKSFLKGLKISLILFIVYILLVPIISIVLNISMILLAITGLAIFAVFIMPIGRGILQGTKSFYSLGINYVSEGTIKVILAFAFISLGLMVFGAISAVILSALLAFLISLLSFSYLYIYKREELEIDELHHYSLNVFFFIATIMILLGMDMIVAKMIFTEETVGQYAVASIIGKMIFFATISVSKSMFPLTSEKSHLPKDSFKLLLKALSITLTISFIALIIFLLFPKPFISILFSNKYLEISGLIIITGLAFTFLSLSNVLLIYTLSQKNKTSFKKIIFFMSVSLLIQFLFLYFSGSSLKTFSLSLLFSNIIIFIMTIFFVNK